MLHHSEAPPCRDHVEGTGPQRPSSDARRAYDIGKAIDRDLQGTHLELGLDFLRKHGESEPVLRAVAAHHMDIDWPSVEAMIVQAADAIQRRGPVHAAKSSSRTSRLEKLEGIADSFQGVSKAFALQAGREIRIVVESDRISDEETVWLSKDIARRIENELEYPGQIVTVIRETRRWRRPRQEPLLQTTDCGLARSANAVSSPDPQRFLPPAYSR